MTYYKDANNKVYAYQDGQTVPSGLTQIATEAEAMSIVNPPKTQAQIDKDRYTRLDAIFNDKTLGLKKLAIAKPNMKDAEAINNQYRIYEEMYKNALKGWYDTTTNNAIIAANEGAKQALAPLTLLLNTIKTVLEGHIANNTANVDALLDDADAVSFKMADLTPTKLQDLKTQFGI